jgi:hypothetical protein
MAKHTPGPWEVGPLANREDGNGNDERVIETYDGGPTIATAWPMADDFNRDDAPEREANARLIAAAPDLLDLVSRLVGEVVTPEYGTDLVIDPAVIHEARALLAQIEGE